MSSVAARPARERRGAPGEKPRRGVRAATRSACEHGAYALALSAALGGLIAAADVRAASILALAGVALSVPARRELLVRVQGKRLEGAAWIASAASAAAFLGAAGLAPPHARGALVATLGLGILLALVHLAATLRLGPRRPGVELAGGALASVAAPVLFLASGGGGARGEVAALGFLIGGHAVARIVLVRWTLAARRALRKGTPDVNVRAPVTREVAVALALVAVAVAGAAAGLLPPIGALVALPGPLAAALSPRPPTPRAVGVRETVVSLAAASLAGLGILLWRSP